MNEILRENLEKGLEIYTEEDFLRDVKEDREYYDGMSLEDLNDLWNGRTKGYKYCFRVVGDDMFYSLPFLFNELAEEIIR